ncbi:MAG: competence/damage-inducible protein A [Bacteroidetes bacterium HGW-Bacteroidetes-17]|jgi:nicotinamide-nucleotide amidase|nr:MAG: competence/damage-inducible protein A [Bacteroidetes bacterium HGW-Bacteroidetes-17]
MKIEIINIGDELLIGQVVNTNASWMAEQFNLAGFEVVQITAISDTYSHIFEALDLAKIRADAVVVTGGLGPTNDDVTKEALCKYFDTTLVFNEEVHVQVEALFKLRGFKVTEINRKQAELPANCIPLKNIHGTAAGMWFEQDDRIIVSIPGVPFEMKTLVSDEIIPRLLKKSNPGIILNKTILTQGIGESALAEIIQNWEESLPSHFKLAYLPQPGIVRLRLTTKGSDRPKLQNELDEQTRALQRLIPKLIFGYGEDTIEQIVVETLLQKQKTISVAESCTGGYISHLITSISGSSGCFMGSIVAYDNRIKEKMIGVSKETLIKYGAVSEEVVIEMASGVQSRFNTDYAIAVSGIAGPDGGTEDKPVGTTWIAITTPDKKVIAKKYLFGEHRGRNIRKAALTALNMIRKEL